MASDEIHYTLPVSTRGRRPRQHGWSQPLTLQLPRVTRLMALAIRFEALLDQHPELSYLDLARLTGVSRSRITQISNLLHLAPDLQERLLFLSPKTRGRDQIHEPALRKLIQIDDWQQQRLQFEAMFGARPEGSSHG